MVAPALEGLEFWPQLPCSRECTKPRLGSAYNMKQHKFAHVNTRIYRHVSHSYDICLVVSFFFVFTPPWGRWTHNLTHIFFRWLGSTTNYIDMICFFSTNAPSMLDWKPPTISDSPGCALTSTWGPRIWTKVDIWAKTSWKDSGLGTNDVRLEWNGMEVDMDRSMVELGSMG